MILKIGLVGCGAIGTEIASAIDRKEISAELIAICDHTLGKAEMLMNTLKKPPKKLGLSELVKVSDIVVEAASQKAVPAVARAALEGGRDLMIMSVGALLEPDIFDMIKNLADKNGCKVYIPSGAISGLDGLKSARLGNIRRVTLTTTKNPIGFEGAPYVLERGIDLTKLKEATVLFEGPAVDAVRAFPANVNVAATLSLTAGSSEVMVKVIADPNVSVNIHEIAAEGDFGRLTTRVENVPSPKNPKTSYLAALSAIATLRSIIEPVKIGT